jgi:hypothetical protein
MRIGEYRIVIQNMTGEILAQVDRTTATGHPAVGEEIVLDNYVYVVERVRHQDDPDARSTRRYTAPCLFVRRRDGVVRGRRKDAHRAPRVLPFLGPRRRHLRGLSSVILPSSLVAILVAAGYDAQLRHFQRRSRGGARLSRVGQGWFVEAGESPSDALSLAREARKQRRRVEQLLCRLAVCTPSPSSLPQPHAHAQPQPQVHVQPQLHASTLLHILDGEDTMNTVYTADSADSTWSDEAREAADSTAVVPTGDDATATSSASCVADERARPAARSPPALS